MNVKDKFKRFWTLSKNRKGFTLVELIVVIAILAILAGVAIPVYNGYIKKAESAADQQLVDSITTAFAAACLTNGYDHVKAAGTSLAVNADGTIASGDPANYDFAIKYEGGITTADAQAIENDFATFFAGNESAKFKGEEYLGGLILDEEGKFGDVTALVLEYNGVKVTISEAAINAFKNSNWGNLPSAQILALVGNVSDMATAIDNNAYLEMLGDEAFLEASAAALGWTKEEYDAKFTAMLEEAGEEWLKSNPNGDVEAYKETLGSQMLANNTILVAAKGAETTGSGIIDLLTANGGTTAKQAIKESMGSDPAAGLSQAALAYGLYTSYKLETDPDNFDVNAPMDFVAVLNTMDDPEFQTYLTEGSGQKDLDGYLAALNTVSTNTGAGGIGTDILMNGFDNADLTALLQQAMGK